MGMGGEEGRMAGTMRGARGEGRMGEIMGRIWGGEGGGKGRGETYGRGERILGRGGALMLEKTQGSASLPRML